MHLILVRHARTIENEQNLLQGWIQGQLSEEGKKQAAMLADTLKGRHIDAIYSSDLARSVETAKAVARNHPDAILSQTHLLRERGFGIFEGRKVTEEEWDRLIGDHPSRKCEGGESYEEVWMRMREFWKQLRQRYADQTILIVGHGGSLRVLYGIIKGLPLEESLNLPFGGNCEPIEMDALDTTVD